MSVRFVEDDSMVGQADFSEWGLPLRIIHLLLAAAVTTQLFVGSFMHSPHSGRVDTFGFITHEALGAIILALVIAHWIWSLTHPDGGIHHLFPWTKAGLRRALFDLLQSVRHCELPSGGPQDRSLVGLVHGLGLLAVTATVLLGGTFFALRVAGANWATLGLIEDVHDVFAVVTWIYWGGHLAATVLHAMLDQSVWRRMFRFGRRRGISKR